MSGNIFGATIHAEHQFVAIVASIFAGKYLIYHAAAVLSFVALAFRDQLGLRSVLMVSIFLNFLYHIWKPEGPAWHEIFWNVVTFGINLKVLIEIVIDRTHLGLSHEQEELFAALDVLTPGQFRALVKLGAWKTAADQTVLTTEGVVPDRLYYVLRGEIDIQKGDRKIATDPRIFIGEVAFLHKSPASATVSVAPETRYLEWTVKDLQRQLESQHSLKNALMSLIGLDMALKVARG